MRRIFSFVGLLAFVLGGMGFVGGPAKASPEYGVNKWAVLVGIDKFTGRTRPNVGSAGDANDLYNALVSLGWPSDHIRLLTNKNATQSAIRSAMQWLVDNSNPNSFSVFHYSGHVKQVNDKRDRDRDGEKMDEFLWPTDNRFIMDNELGTYMRSLRGYAWVDISGCEAAGLNDNIASDRRLFTGSSQESEKSYEDAAWHNSVYTGLFKRALAGAVTGDGDGRVSLQDAFSYAQGLAPGYTLKQKTGAQHPYIAGGDGRPWYLKAVPPAAGTYTYDVAGTESLTGGGKRNLPGTMTLVASRVGGVGTDDVAFDMQFSNAHAERAQTFFGRDMALVRQDTLHVSMGLFKRNVTTTYNPGYAVAVVPFMAGASRSGVTDAFDADGKFLRTEDWRVTDIGPTPIGWQISLQRTSRPGAAEALYETRTMWFDTARRMWSRWEVHLHTEKSGLVKSSYDLNYAATLANFSPA
jgi:hypothetical protein